MHQSEALNEDDLSLAQERDRLLRRENDAQHFLMKAFSEATHAGSGSAEAKKALEQLIDATKADPELRSGMADVLSTRPKDRELFEGLVKVAEADLKVTLRRLR